MNFNFNNSKNMTKKNVVKTSKRLNFLPVIIYAIMLKGNVSDKSKMCNYLICSFSMTEGGLFYDVLT